MSRVVCLGVSAGYNGHTVLRGLDLDVAAGEWVGLIGPNGAGKTTLLRVVAGTHPSAGEIEVDNERVDALSQRARARLIAVVPQTPVVPGGMSVLDYVLLGRNPFISYWGTESAGDVAAVRDLLSQLDLTGFESRPMATLSGGERQRAVVARALAQEAGLLLLDEPTAALDLGHRQHVLDHVDQLRRHHGIAVLSAVHDLTLAAQYADRLVLMDEGEIVASGKPLEVLTADLLTRHYRAAVSVLHDDWGNPVIAPRREADIRSGRRPERR
jgi:iron complex transport system ATP-binding protein